MNDPLDDIPTVFAIPAWIAILALFLIVIFS